MKKQKRPTFRLQTDVDDEIFRDFKAACVKKGMKIREAIEKLMEAATKKANDE